MRKGITFVPILVMIATLVAFGIVLYFAFRTAKPPSKEHSSINATQSSSAPTRLLYTEFEGPVLYLRTMSITGSDIKTILSYDWKPVRPEVTSQPAQLIRVAISPDGKNIAYKLPYSDRSGLDGAKAPIFIINSDGSNKRQVLPDANEFVWYPDGRRILYSHRTPTPSDTGGAGVSPTTPGAEWRVYDLRAQKDSQLLAPGPKNMFVGFGSWLSDNEALMVGSTSDGVRPYRFNLSTKSSTEIKLPEHTDITSIRTNQEGSKTVFLEATRFGGADCKFFEWDPSNMSRLIVAFEKTICEGIGWDGEALYYGRGTGPQGRITTTETGESGYYLLLSIYRYDFATGKDELVLSGAGKEVYRFQGLVPGQGLIVTAEKSKPDVSYQMQLRSFDGQLIQNLLTSNREPWFIGSVQ